jgi:hypothetical protein
VNFAYLEEMAPGLARKILIFATIDGLVLEPLEQKRRPAAQATKITYKDASITPAPKEGGKGNEAGKGFEAFGIVGTPAETVLAMGSTDNGEGL